MKCMKYNEYIEMSSMSLKCRVLTFLITIMLFCMFTNAENFSKEVQFPEVSIEDVKKAICDNNILIIDARPALFYELGHIEGAANLPIIDFDESFPSFNKNKPLKKVSRIIVYCSDSFCKDSAQLAQKLNEKGIRNICIYKAGWEEWKTKLKIK